MSFTHSILSHTLTAALVVELLEYCDEYEGESQESISDKEMEEGENDGKEQP